MNTPTAPSKLRLLPIVPTPRMFRLLRLKALRGFERHVRVEVGEALDAQQVLLLDRRRVRTRERHGHVLSALGPLLRGYDDLLQRPTLDSAVEGGCARPPSEKGISATLSATKRTLDADNWLQSGAASVLSFGQGAD